MNNQTHQAHISHITDSLDKAMGQHMELLTEMTRFTKDETFRFANKRLERTEQAVEQFHGCRGIAGIFNAQHEWLHDLMQDYMDQSLRYADLLRTLGQNAQSHVRAAASDLNEKVGAEMEEAGQKTRQAADSMAAAGGEIFRQAEAPSQPH